MRTEEVELAIGNGLAGIGPTASLLDVVSQKRVQKGIAQIIDAIDSVEGFIALTPTIMRVLGEVDVTQAPQAIRQIQKLLRHLKKNMEKC